MRSKAVMCFKMGKAHLGFLALIRTTLELGRASEFSRVIVCRFIGITQNPAMWLLGQSSWLQRAAVAFGLPRNVTKWRYSVDRGLAKRPAAGSAGPANQFEYWSRKATARG